MFSNIASRSRGYIACESGVVLKRIEYYGLVGLCCTKGVITSQQDKERFEKTQVALKDFKDQGNKGSLGEFYVWLQGEMSDTAGSPQN